MFWATKLHCFISSLDSVSDLITVVLCFSVRHAVVNANQEMVWDLMAGVARI